MRKERRREFSPSLSPLPSFPPFPHWRRTPFFFSFFFPAGSARRCGQQVVVKGSPFLLLCLIMNQKGFFFFFSLPFPSSDADEVDCNEFDFPFFFFFLGLLNEWCWMMTPFFSFFFLFFPPFFPPLFFPPTTPVNNLREKPPPLFSRIWILFFPSFFPPNCGHVKEIYAFFLLFHFGGAGIGLNL